jgi:hypothetical protein
MTQARIVLRDAALERGEQLLEVTRLGSLTELINVMFSRYGRHLEETWEVQPVSPTYAKAEPSPEVEAQTMVARASAEGIAPPPVEPDFTFDEPLTGL